MGLKVTDCDQTIRIPPPLALHNSPGGLSGTKETLPQAGIKVPFPIEAEQAGILIITTKPH